jgi:hypothetical protein
MPLQERSKMIEKVLQGRYKSITVRPKHPPNKAVAQHSKTQRSTA